MVEILPVETREQYEAIEKAAAADKHYVLAPTHYWQHKNGEVAGYFSNGVVPVGHFWMDSKSKPRESFEAVKLCENIAKATHKWGMIACAETSPFYKTLEKHFNYVPMLSKTTLLWVPM